jgi:hypothetical protein
MHQLVKEKLRLNRHVLRIPVIRKLVALRALTRKAIRRHVALRVKSLLAQGMTRKLVALRREMLKHLVLRVETRSLHVLRMVIINLAALKIPIRKKLTRKQKRLRRLQVFRSNIK